MSNHYYYPAPYPYPAQTQFVPLVNNELFKNMATGAIVGAAASTATQLHKPASERHNAVGEVLKAGAVTGLAVGAVSMVQHSLGCDKKLSTMAAMFVTGTAVMYALNSASEKQDKSA